MIRSISGEIDAGEARGTATAIGRPQRGSLPYYYFVQLVVVGGGVLVGLGFGWVIDTFVSHDRHPDPIFTMAVGFVLGCITYMLLARRLVVGRFRRRMSDRAMSLRFRQTMTLEDETIELTSGAVHAVAPWSAITEVFKSKGYWIFMIGMNAWLVPTRFFSDDAAEREFISMVLSRVSSGACERRRDALKFVAT